jgi:hypothetical protein
MVFVASLPNLREFFTLRDQELRAARLSPFDRTEVRTEIERAAELMREADESSASFVRTQLARQALSKVIVATAAANRLAAESSADDWPDVDEAVRELSALPGFDKHQPAVALLGGSDVLTDREYRLLADLFAYVERLPDLRSPRDFLLTRWLRRSGVISFLFVACWVALTPANLARGKMVTSSSTCPEMPTADLGRSSLSRVVDGVRLENSFAICTNAEVRPWITVDLGAPRSIQKIVVYPHTSGPWGKTDIPQQIRVSLDNEHFEVVGVRTQLYTTDFPWRLTLRDKQAQYVQLIGAARSGQKLVLDEIEVFGR